MPDVPAWHGMIFHGASSEDLVATDLLKFSKSRSSKKEWIIMKNQSLHEGIVRSHGFFLLLVRSFFPSLSIFGEFVAMLFFLYLLALFLSTLHIYPIAFDLTIFAKH